MARRNVSREDRTLWDAATRSVAPLRHRRAPRPVESAHDAMPDGRAINRRPSPTTARAAAQPALAPGAAPGVDRRTAEKQRRGQLPIEARLDLHGMTQKEAHRALARFIADCDTRGHRNLLIITGKGSAGDAERGVLKAAVPRWLNESELRPRILSFAWAQPRHGGGGALYLLLRRRR